MTTEEFDDSIRQKIESIETNYTNAELTAAFRHVQAHRSTGWQFRYATHAVVATVAAGIAGLLVWNVMLHKQQVEQQQIIGQLTSSLRRIETALQTQRVDTVFVIKGNESTGLSKTTDKNETNIAAVENYSQKINSNEVVRSNAKSNVSDADAKTDAAITAKPEPSEDEKNKSQHRTSTTVRASEGDNLPNLNTRSAGVAAHNSQTDPQSVSEQSANNQDNSVDGATDSSVMITNTAVSSVSAFDSVAGVSDSLPQNHEPLPQKQAIRTREPIDWSSFLGKFSIRPGGVVDVARRQVGFAAVGEIRYAKRIGIMSGIKGLNIHSEDFFDRNEFSKTRGYDFYDSYKDQSANLDPQNINMRTVLLQLPVYVTYYQPLKNNFSLLVSAGTDIDLIAWQNVSFDNQGSDSREHHSFKASIPTTPFNTATVLLGVEKQWSRCALQINPFVCIPTQSVLYRLNKPDGGLQIRFLFGRRE